jgi:hypothetical protein
VRLSGALTYSTIQVSGVDHVTTWYETTTASAFAVDYTLLLEWIRGAQGLKGEGPSSKDTIRIDLSKPELPWVRRAVKSLRLHLRLVANYLEV